MLCIESIEVVFACLINLLTRVERILCDEEGFYNKENLSVEERSLRRYPADGDETNLWVDYLRIGTSQGKHNIYERFEDYPFIYGEWNPVGPWDTGINDLDESVLAAMTPVEFFRRVSPPAPNEVSEEYKKYTVLADRFYVMIEETKKEMQTELDEDLADFVKNVAYLGLEMTEQEAKMLCEDIYRLKMKYNNADLNDMKFRCYVQCNTRGLKYSQLIVLKRGENGQQLIFPDYLEEAIEKALNGEGLDVRFEREVLAFTDILSGYSEKANKLETARTQFNERDYCSTMNAFDEIFEQIRSSFSIGRSVCVTERDDDEKILFYRMTGIDTNQYIWDEFEKNDPRIIKEVLIPCADDMVLKFRLYRENGKRLVSIFHFT